MLMSDSPVEKYGWEFLPKAVGLQGRGICILPGHQVGAHKTPGCILPIQPAPEAAVSWIHTHH